MMTPCAKKQHATVIYKVFVILFYFCFLIEAIVLDSVLTKPSCKEKESLFFQVFAFRKIPGLIHIRALADLGFSHTTHLHDSNTCDLVFLSI